MTQAKLDFFSLAPHMTQEQIDLQNQREMHTTDLIISLMILLSSFLILKIFPLK